ASMLSLEHLNSVFEISPVPSVVLQPDAPVFTIAAANRAFLQLTRTLNQDIIGRGLFEVFPQQEDEHSARRKKSVTSSLDHVLYLKKPHKLGLVRYDLQGAENYETRFWNIDSYPLLNAEGEVQFIIQHPVDITTHILSGNDQNNFQSNLLQEQHLQHAFFKDYPDGIFTLDLKGNFLNANQVLLDLAECSEEELLRLSFVSFIDLQNYDLVFKYFRNAAQGMRQNFDIPIRTAKGNRRILNISTLPIKIGNEISAIYLVAKDISALKDAEQQIEDKNQRIFNILESITDAFFAVDRNWTVNHWNKEAEKILGMPRENILGKNLWEVYQDAIPLKFYSEYHLAVAENKTVTFEEFFPPLQKWFEVSAYPSVDGLSVYFKDITPRKQTEVELRQAIERHYALFNFSPLPKWVYDIETLMFIDVNEAAITNYGFSREEFLSMNIRDLWPVEDLSQCDEMIETRIKCRLPNRGIHRHMKKNGEVIYVEFQSQPLPSWGKNARITTALDVTEKLKAEEALQISERRFKSLVQDGSDLIAILDPVGNYQYVSPTSMTVLGLEPEFFLGKNAFDFIHQEDMARVMDQF
ncbi:MAG TPA: PAS domain S-box protein, partial [Sphingobacteriaceae bacterium]